MSARTGGVRQWRWLLAALMLIAVVAGQAISAGAAELPTITGRVTNEGGVGIPGVTVRAVDSVNYATFDYGSTTTDGDGYYVLPVDAPGNVVVMFDPADSNFANETDYVGEFYEDEPYPTQATYLPPGSTDINATLSAGGTVSGTVYAPGGSTVVVGIQVMTTNTIFGASAVTGPDGAYVLRGVPADYMFIKAVTAEYNEAKETDFVDASVFVDNTAGTPLTGKDITLGQGGRVEGTVTGSEGGLSDIDVRVQSASGTVPPIYSAVTAADGTYVVHGVPAGTTYRVSFSPVRHNAIYEAGYAPEWYSNARLVTGYTPVSVTAGAPTLNIDASLEAGGSVSGTVFAPDGVTPLEGIYVYESMSGVSDWTDEAGRYSLRGFNTSSVRVGFVPTTYNAVYGAGYATEFYNNASTMMSATYIPVTLGADTPGINATLAGDGPTFGSVVGIVYGPDGETPLEGIAVTADNGVSATSVETDVDGVYMIDGLAPGSYEITYDPTDYNIDADPDLQGRTYFETVAVVAGTTEALDPVALGIPGAIAGHVYAADGVTPLEGIVVQAVDDTGMVYNQATTDVDGYYMVTGVWSSAKVWFTPHIYNAANSTALQSEYYDDADQFTAAYVHPGSAGIDASLTEGAGISGTVYGPDGETPLEGVLVYTDMGSTSDYTDENGEYRLTGLFAGMTYRVRFDTTEYNGSASTPLLGEYYEGAQDWFSATPVRVEADAITPGIDATLDEASLITGTVYAPGGTAGLAGVSVTARLNDSFDQSRSFTTGDGGTYTAAVPAGTYSVYFDPSSYNQMNTTGYVGEWWENSHSSDSKTMVTVDVASPAPGIDATLEVGGTITGVVRDPDGTGVQGIQVSAYGSPYYMSTATALTDSNGVYTLRGLEAGSYYVRFDAMQYNMWQGGDFLSEYYQNARVMADATLVPVTLGGTASGINADLEHGGSISGHVYNADGTAALQGVSVRASGTGLVGGSATTGPEGTYTIKGLYGGDYTVSFDAGGYNSTNVTDYLAEYYDGAPDAASADQVPVTVAVDTPDIDATLEMGGSISGTVYAPDETTPLSDVAVRILGLGSDATRIVMTDTDGTYVAHGLRPGSYVVEFDPSYYYSSSLRRFVGEFYNNVRLPQQATPIEVLAGQDSGGKDAILEEGASIGGTVCGPDGETGVSGISVMAYDAEGQWVASDMTDGGAYEIVGLSAGSYTVYFYPWQYNNNEDAGLLSEYYENTRVASDAQVLDLVLGQKKTGVNATLEEGATLAGVITGDADAKLRWVDVYAYDAAQGLEYRASTDVDGAWEMTAVEPGTYVLEFNPVDYNVENETSYIREFYNDKASPASADPVTVGLADERLDLNAQLVQGGLTLSATVNIPDGAGLTEGFVDLYERLADGTERYLGDVELLEAPDTTDRTVVFSGLIPGDYLLRAEVWGDDYWATWAYDKQPTASYYWDGPDVEDSRMEFANAIPLTTGNVAVQMDPPDLGDLAGSVTDTDGLPLQDIRVDIYAQAPSGAWCPVEYGYSVENGMWGAQLPPGTYKAHFYEQQGYTDYGVQDVWYLDAPDEASARTFEVLAGQTTTLDPQVMLFEGGGLMTNVEVSPPMPGPFGWYATAPTITLTCTDPTATIWYFWGTDASAKYTAPLVAPEGTNTLTVWAEDALGNLEPQNTREFKVDTLAPEAPTNLAAPTSGVNSVDLTWDAAVDSGSGVDYYRIYVDGDYKGQWSGTSYQAVELAPDTTYQFTVTAVDWAGHESASTSSVMGTTLADPVAGGPTPVYRLYQTTNGSVLLTDDQVEVQTLLAAAPDKYIFEGIAFFTDPELDTASVWRFRKVSNDTYFYTSNLAERNLLVTMGGMWAYEGEAFLMSPGAGTTTLHRFTRPAVGDPLITASADEKAVLQADPLATYSYEGVAGYVNGGLTLASGPGSISGTVRDASGTVLGGVWVRASTLTGGTWSAQSGPDGTYSIEGLPDGDYLMTYSTWPNSTLTGWELLPEYYPDAHAFSEAGPVSVSSGSTETGIDAQLEGPGPDVTAPVTSIDVTATVGLDGWFVTAPKVTLVPNEPATSWYTWDGGVEQEYVEPFYASQGTSVLEYWSVDSADNEEVRKTRTIKYDGEGPTAPTDFSAAQTSAGGEVTLTWTGSVDAVSDVKQYIIYEQDGMTWNQVALVPTTDTTYVLQDVAEGEHTYSVAAMDNAGNLSAYSDSDYLVVDRTAPTTEAVVGGGHFNNGWYSTAPFITLNPSEPGCTTYYYWGSDAQAEYGAPLTPPSGTNTLTFWSVDAVGNTGAPATAGPYKVDTKAPAGATGFTATADGSFAIDLSWDAVTTQYDGTPEVSGVSYYTIVVGTDFYTTTDTSYRVTGLTPDTFYEFGLIASDVPGNPGPTVTASATTAPDLTAPKTALALSGGTAGENGWYTAAPTITLTADEPATTYYQWDVDATATEYTGPFALVAGQHTLSFWSEDGYGNVEDPKGVQSFKLDTSAPPAPTGLSATQTAPGEVTVTWNAVSDPDSGLHTYFLKRTGTPEWNTEIGETTYVAVGLGEGTYFYTVEAVNWAGLVATSTTVEVTVDNTAPTTALSADPATANGAGGWYKTAPSITLTSEPGAIIFYHWDATPEAEYETPLTPADGTHTLNYSAEDLVGNVETNKTATYKVDTVAPTVPAGLTATAPSFNTVDLSWTAATDATSGVAKYLVYQGATLLGETTGVTYQVTGLTGETAYSFTVKSVDVAGHESAASTPADVTTPAEPLSGTFVIDGGAAYNTAGTLVFTSNVAGAAEMRYRVSADAGATWDDWSGWSAYAASVNVASGDGARLYQVEYRNGARGVTLSDSIIVDTTKPTAPTGLTATTASSSSINLAWAASTDASGVVKYKIYKDGVFFAETTSRSYSVTGLAASTTYSFTVTAVDAAGLESDKSAAASAKTSAAAVAPTPVWRFYNARLGTHFYTASPSEKANVIANLSHIYTLEGEAYRMNPAKNTATLYRFYKNSTGTHFYTASPVEKANVQANLSHIYTFEGPAYNVSTSLAAGRITIYRFFHTGNGTHFYTASATERDNVRANLSHIYNYEGPAFYIAQ